MKSFQISIPTDDAGFLGHACDATACRRYFKVKLADRRDEMYCPYCGAKFSKNALLTGDQLAFAQRAAVAEVMPDVQEMLQRSLQNAFRGSKSITFKPAPRISRRRVQPTYAEREVDTEIQCSECGSSFQIYGIFGQCPACACENLQVYDANWSSIRQRIAQGGADQQRDLRHAYGDLVSAFEVFCGRKAHRLVAETANFQDLFDARKFFKKYAGVDLLDDIDDAGRLDLRRLFQKRHVLVHAGGAVTARYVQKIPEDRDLVGTRVTLGLDELERAATAMRTALASLSRRLDAPGK